MAYTVTRSISGCFPAFLTDVFWTWLARLVNRRLKKELSANATDKFLEFLLRGMDRGFSISKGYRKNIENFEAGYVFRTADKRVSTAVSFKDSDMKVYEDEDEIEDWDVRVTFKDSTALISFLFSKNQDIINSLLANEVEVDGNLNYIYKFGFMARDLVRRLPFV
jgi:hypothetical protein